MDVLGLGTGPQGRRGEGGVMIVNGGRTCESCVFFCVADRGRTVISTCRRYAPQVRSTITEAGGTAWPRVDADDWCGEHSWKPGLPSPPEVLTSSLPEAAPQEERPLELRSTRGRAK